MKPARAFRPEFHRRGFAQIVIIAVIALVIGAGAMYGYQKLTTKPSPSPQPSVTSQSPSPDETVYTEDTRSANWKTYENTNQEIRYSIKYLSNAKLEISPGSITIFVEAPVREGTGGQIGALPQGITVYERNRGASSLESQSRPTEKIMVGNYEAIRWTDNHQYGEDIWIENPSGKNSVRISINTKYLKEPYDSEYFDLYNQILSTFRFLD
ncbi:hypothetical protein A3I53_01025 [Candidatus Curtissbacteria bacterium RIFCSPLOWO2_02_FULL_40_13b]|uniref:Uncharacterized protein n=1 Tax=Candidatus Curtissbacteria bacterium RIFCSPLOWO2_02_FULL_40_13b TaxID=1797733 RepID=A0A1F5HXX2_9BACT|nr:MAG: hypothetical protein A3I53_01025 [Candidatus Curtissbacteria bacterium RIFCSPLOWO2_02_FULL_40_13b]